MSVALASAAGVTDEDADLLIAALAERGVSSELALWDEARDWDAHELVVVRSTWDYTARREEFLAWARSVARLANPYPIIEYSSDKRYLFDLARRGFPVIPTSLVVPGQLPVFPEGDVVVKPSVGAGSMDAERFFAHEHERARALVARLHAAGRDVLVQPYVHSVDEAGERALIFLGGAFSHAMTKAAMLNVAGEVRDRLYRAERMSRAEAEPEALELASAVLSEFADLTYARVDLLHTPEGWAILELEMVEPSLFLSFEPAAPGRLAEAIIAAMP